MSDYSLRGKCKEMSEELVAKDPSLRLVRGYYHCPMWGKQKHWWTQREDGTIIDPTVNQFPSPGMGEYEEFDGMLACENCGKPVREEEAVPCGNYGCCSTRCAMRLVGL